MPNEQRPLKVFLSYASQDRPVVRELSRHLIREGWIDTWLDEKSLLPGQDWRLKIEEAVEDSDIVIICLSSNSVTKEGYVQKELRYAREIALEKPEETIFLVPLRLDECDVPRGLRFYQWADYFGEKKEETYSALIESLKLRHNQKLMFEEQERIRKEKLDREISEKIAREEAEREAIEKARLEAEERLRQKAAKEKVEREAVEKVEQEKIKREKAKRDKAKREAVEKAKLENAERRTAQIAALQGAFLAFFTSAKSTLAKALPFLRIAGFAGIAIGILWGVSRAVPKFILLIPTPKDTATQSLSGQATVTTPLVPLTKTSIPSAMATKTHTPTITLAAAPLQAEITDAKGATMRLIPQGEFTMGITNKYWNLDAQPKHTVFLNDFYIDKYEVTNFLYKTCVDAGVCEPPQIVKSYRRSDYYGDSRFDTYPVINVNWFQAEKYCEWREARLPTEAEWEKAARGTDQRVFTWDGFWDSNNPDCTRGNFVGCGVGDTTKVGIYEGGKSQYGIYDLLGNVEEWVADWYSENYYAESPSSNPWGPNSGTKRVLRGGSWDDRILPPDTYERVKNNPEFSSYLIGFRCARSANETDTSSDTPAIVPTHNPTALPTEIADAKKVPMIYVPAGDFVYTDSLDRNSEIYLKSFYIDKFEVTNALYKECLKARVCTDLYKSIYLNDPVYADHPVVYLYSYQADALCKWRGASLPTVYQWQKAARGPDGRSYPWGNNDADTRANLNGSLDGFATTAPVGSFGGDLSPYGVYDMAGNVEEITSQVDFSGDRVTVGRSWRDGGWASAYETSHYGGAIISDYTGFRCVRDTAP